MCIKLDLEKVIVQGVKSYRVVGIKALDRHSVGVDTEARHEYLNGYPKAFKFGKEDLLLRQLTDPGGGAIAWTPGIAHMNPYNTTVTHVRPGDVLSVTEMNALRKGLKKAGQRLAEINARRREQWSGREVIEI